MLTQTLDADYDVVIAGGGMVGGSFALLLQALLSQLPASGAASSALKVLLVDSADFSQAADGSDAVFDARSTALSWGSRLIYLQAGLWSVLAPDVTAIRHIQVSDRGHPGATRLHSDEMGVEALGYVAENRLLNRAINTALLESECLQLSALSSVTDVTPIPQGVQLQIQQGARSTTIRSRLLIIADGGRSTLCERLGITIQRKPYGQQALISNIAFEKPHQGWAFERFTDTGPMAVLPLPDLQGEHRGALIWTLTDAQAPEIMALPENEFLRALQQRFGYRLGEIQRAGSRHLFPLSLNLATEQIRPGIVLLGNVAHTLHPVAGQGLNLALRDARELAELIADTVGQPGYAEQLGSYAWLQQFEARQRADQQRTVGFSDATTRLFSNSKPLLTLGRNLGLLGMELLPPARHWFARQAMGMADRRSLSRL